ncbi:DNA primase/polymerase [Microbacterium phage Hendrix]|uniref:DNA primase/polymerase n=1 Tax=Microbacterium phage Hendrix TaxID=2182341 RepID=A0A2U8UUL7_9CAUD|nr:DNA primase/polymerase [Microbacterium phage Hendrix]AWN07762.1 DNA primase/polymerase [Microbacterium phage Hendrix]
MRRRGWCLMTQDTGNTPASVSAALEAVKRGYSPIPIFSRDKKPALANWTKGVGTVDPAEVAQIFTERATQDPIAENIGLLLGAPSGGLIDVDLDHPKTRRLKDHFLPRTAMRSGRAGRPGSHYWFVAEEGTLQGYRKYTMPKKPDGRQGDVIVEYRSTGGQSVIPPSIHPSGEDYRWEGDPWGGERGAQIIHGRKLSVQVATLALATVLLDQWPTQGSRHDAYLALAGGLLWFGERNVHPFWGDNGGANTRVLIRALAEATLDEDGPDSREAEVMKTTLNRIYDGRMTAGFPKLAEIIGDRHVKQARSLIAEVEQLAGYQSRQAPEIDRDMDHELTLTAAEVSELPMEERDPLMERVGTWQSVDLEPYLSGAIKPVDPELLERSDSTLQDPKFLMYPGRVNMLYGSSESAKSWIALYLTKEVIRNGQRVMYLDLEDDPVNTLSRLQLLGLTRDDFQGGMFRYIRPEDPLAPMQRNRWGKAEETSAGRENQELFERELNEHEPSLIVADGMSVLYGLHGLNTNDTVDTDVITGWMKKLTRGGKTTVVIIDHTGKGSERGSLPIGSQHKVSMVQGTLLQVWPTRQPMPGALGTVELIVLKDRPGQVRKIAAVGNGGKAQQVAKVTLDSRTPGATYITIDPPTPPVQVAASGQLDLQRSLDAEKAEKLSNAKDAIIYKVFRGDDKVELTALQISERLSRVEDLTPEEREMRRAKNGQWSGWGAKALKNLVEGDKWLEQLGTTKDRRYRLKIKVEVPNVDFSVDSTSTDSPTVSLDASSPLGPVMTVDDDD